ncbi:MAG: hypothetical protein Q4P30_03635 [Eubacteriales bacterium]|nr:hypothetical protein [Eubacteriales bacterium]
MNEKKANIGGFIVLAGLILAIIGLIAPYIGFAEFNVSVLQLMGDKTFGIVGVLPIISAFFIIIATILALTHKKIGAVILSILAVLCYGIQLVIILDAIGGNGMMFGHYLLIIAPIVALIGSFMVKKKVVVR